MKDFYRRHDMTIQLIGFLLLIIAVTAFMGRYIANEEEDHYRAAYPVWVKMTGSTNVSYEEWRALKRVERDTSQSQVVPMPILIPTR